jgi:putative CocE/NonD family hydrolase
MIPMRDGVHLYTAVYVPKTVPGDHPILMERTPYSAGPYGPDKYSYFRGSPKFREAGYIFAFQDVRGKYLSEGEYENIRPEIAQFKGGTDESTDTYDTVDWLIHHVPGNNGHVGLWGTRLAACSTRKTCGEPGISTRRQNKKTEAPPSIS